MRVVFFIGLVMLFCDIIVAQETDTVARLSVTMSNLRFNTVDSSFSLSKEYTIPETKKVHLLNVIPKSSGNEEVKIIFIETLPSNYSAGNAHAKLRAIKKYLKSENVALDAVFKMSTNRVDRIEYEELRNSNEDLDTVLVVVKRKSGTTPQE